LLAESGHRLLLTQSLANFTFQTFMALLDVGVLFQEFCFEPFVLKRKS
jgi:hypothetical protein